MNRKVIRILRMLPKVVLVTILTGFVLAILSQHIKIEVITVRALDSSRSKLLQQIKTDILSTVSTIQVKAFVPTTEQSTVTTTETMTTVEPRINFDNVINPHPYNYKRLPTKVCKYHKDQDNPVLLVLVKSNVFQIGHRMAIRSTWGNFTNSSTVQLAFLLGDSRLVHSFTDMEFTLYHDIIQEDFVDEYKNNTLKTVMGFNWVVSYCSQAKFVLFVDDDYYVNVQNLLDLIDSLSEQSSIFMGYKYVNAVVRRNKNSKWYMSTKEYADKFWPPYISGGSMLLSIDIVSNLTEAFPHVKPIFIDDVYIGIVSRALNISLTHDKRFEVKYLPNKLDTLISSHDFAPNVLIQEWNQPEDNVVKN